MKRYWLTAIAVCMACSDSVGPAPEVTRSTTPNAPQAHFVTVAPGVRLEVLDYGGTGAPLVLLAGSGNTAHVFAAFAWRFTDRFHVIAITRRGFGYSSQPADGYDTRTLSEDLRTVLDSLRLSQVNLVGHSLAGDEMTRFAGDHPDRVRRLVYLDAAYDRVALRSIVQQFPFPPPPMPTTRELSSPEGFSNYVRRVRGVALPAEEIAATYRFAPDGTFQGEVTPPEVYAALLAGEEAPDYARVKANSLGIYAVATNATGVVPWIAPTRPVWPVAQEVFHRVYEPFYLGQRIRFDTEVARSTRLDFEGQNHYLFLSAPESVASAVRAFLR